MTDSDQGLLEGFYYDQILEIEVETGALRAEVWKDRPDFHRMLTASVRLEKAIFNMISSWRQPPESSEEE